MIWLRLAISASLFLAIAGCHAAPRDAAVDPSHYDSFFLWAGVKPPEALRKARMVYLLAGEVRQRDRGYVPLRAAPTLRGGPQIWMVVRVDRLDWEDGVYRRILSDLAAWQHAGNAVAGLQIDFDARTRGLRDYHAFLSGLRSRLPRQYRLSITGLMDWSAHGDPRALGQLAGVVDEVVVQTYQGTHTIPGYDRYMASLQSLPLPYKVALVERGAWHAPPGLEHDPEFRGYVVFLLAK